MVSILDPKGKIIARGISRFASNELDKVIGLDNDSILKFTAGARNQKSYIETFLHPFKQNKFRTSLAMYDYEDEEDDLFGPPPQAAKPSANNGIDFEKELNNDQYLAVTAPDGPALVLAGAGIR